MPLCPGPTRPHLLLSHVQHTHTHKTNSSISQLVLILLSKCSSKTYHLEPYHEGVNEGASGPLRRWWECPQPIALNRGALFCSLQEQIFVSSSVLVEYNLFKMDNPVSGVITSRYCFQKHFGH